jgi:hypothetical protein
MTTDSGLPLGSDDDVLDGEAGRPADRRRVLVAGAALAAGALALGGLLVLGGGTTEDELALGVPPASAVVPNATPSPVPTPSPSAVAQSSTALGRNPFQALYVEPVGAAAAAQGGAAPAGSAPAEVAAPGTPAPAEVPAQAAMPEATAPVGTAPGTTDPRPAPAAPTARTVLLTGVHGTGDARRASFSFETSTAVVAVGQDFGPSGELLLLSLQEGPGDGQWTAVVQVGQGEPFDVVSGRKTALP